MKRYLVEPIHQDLKEKMVFLGGPRQVGKTTLALGLIKGANETHPAYLNWDVRATQKLILQVYSVLPVAEIVKQSAKELLATRSSCNRSSSVRK